MTIFVDIAAVLLALSGFLVAFRSEWVRGCWRMLTGGNGRAPVAPSLGEDEPARYVMRIAGVMLMAFGMAIFLLVTIVHVTNAAIG